MELLNQLKQEATITDFFRPECEDEGICIEVDEDIDENSILIIKPDDYYNSLNLDKTPASVDCLIIQYCESGIYKIYLIELKNFKNARQIDNKNLIEKYRTTLFDFISDRYRHIFNEFEFKTYLWLCAGKVTDDKIRNYSLDFLLSLDHIKFRGLWLGVYGFPPVPTIKSC